ncbi:MAG TPA: PrsW family glutamic-type intramembrane protease [Streptosporangiaceae bacterium]|nr:PrsW family glutamic-type intramembrane protease [Streptosporangiaceae bacterium]
MSAALLCVFGAGVLSWEFVRFLVVFPEAAALAAVLELPVVVIGFALLRRLRPTRAPALLWSAAALVWGGTAAAGCALLANQGLAGLWAKSEGISFASDWSASLSAPLNEELLKLCGVVMVGLAAPLAINGPLDGLVYGALTGLGFQSVENVTYGLNAIVMSGGTNPDHAVLDSALLRVGTAGAGSHWTMTAVAGAGAGYLILHTRRRRLIRDAGRGGYASRQPADAPAARPGYGLLLAAAACVVAAAGMHLLFDAPAVAIEFKVAVNFALVAILYLLLSSAFVRRARDLLADAAAAGLVSTTEAGSVLSRRRRRRELRRIHPPAERDALRARQQEILAELDAEAA